MSDDPTASNPEHYRTLWENEYVRVLEYRDEPGAVTTPHAHPNSVMVTLSGFRRRVFTNEREVEVALEPGQAVWVAAQRHTGQNIGDTPTHSIFIELKGAAAGEEGDVVGPAAS